MTNVLRDFTAMAIDARGIVERSTAGGASGLRKAEAFHA